MRLIYWVAGAMLVWITACVPDHVFDENVPVKDYQWYYKDTAAFEVNIQDTVAAYNIYVNIRHNGSYAFSNLWIFVHTQKPGGPWERKRVELPLADKTGRWYGANMSDVYDQQIPIQYKAQMPRKGLYRFVLEQNMRVDPLENVMAVGIRLEKAKPEPAQEKRP